MAGHYHWIATLLLLLIAFFRILLPFLSSSHTSFHIAGHTKTWRHITHYFFCTLLSASFHISSSHFHCFHIHYLLLFTFHYFHFITASQLLSSYKFSFHYFHFFFFTLFSLLSFSFHIHYFITFHFISYFHFIFFFHCISITATQDYFQLLLLHYYFFLSHY